MPVLPIVTMLPFLIDFVCLFAVRFFVTVCSEFVGLPDFSALGDCLDGLMYGAGSGCWPEVVSYHTAANQVKYKRVKNLNVSANKVQGLYLNYLNSFVHNNIIYIYIYIYSVIQKDGLTS